MQLTTWYYVNLPSPSLKNLFRENKQLEYPLTLHDQLKDIAYFTIFFTAIRMQLVPYLAQIQDQHKLQAFKQKITQIKTIYDKRHDDFNKFFFGRKIEKFAHAIFMVIEQRTWELERNSRYSTNWKAKSLF